MTVNLFRRRIGWALLSLGLGGCRALPPATLPPTDLSGPGFTLRGRLSAQHLQESLRVDLSWEHRAQTELVTISGPLGQTLAELMAVPGLAELRTAQGEYHRAESVTELIEWLLPIPLPLVELVGWVQGIPGAHATALQRDEHGKIAHFDDAGWRVVYRQYAEEGEVTTPRPRLLDVSTEHTRIRLVIDEWTSAR